MTQLDLNEYTVGWICALTTELLAAQLFLDEEHHGDYTQANNDNNSYTLGRIGPHKVAIASLPMGTYGTTSAATVARDMLHSFPNIKIGLMVGIGGGAPSPRNDIRLGDIVVGTTGNGFGGVFQYDFGKAIQGESFKTTGFLNQAPPVLQIVVGALNADFERRNPAIHTLIEGVLATNQRVQEKLSRPELDTDKLFKSDVIHTGEETCGAECLGHGNANLEVRSAREQRRDDPVIHYGTIASANSLMKDATIRNRLAINDSVLCFEMEAAGLMNHFPCLVIRGICDYSDSHKNKQWQGYAAMTAAAYAKKLLCKMKATQVQRQEGISQILARIVQQMTDSIKKELDAVRYDGHMLQIKNWLSPPNLSTNSTHAREVRHPGTGTWFLNSTTFGEWKTGARQHLWLRGLAGCGKTVLSFSIVDHLKEINNHQIIMNFFFDFRDPKKQKLSDVLRSLIFQLYEQQVGSRDEVKNLYAAHDDRHTQPTTKALSETLQNMIRASNRLYIILDALDECVERAGLLAWMKSFLSEFTQVQVLVTGRPEAEFEHCFRQLFGVENYVSMDKESVNADIRAYVKAQLERNPEFQKWTLIPSILKDIEEQVGNKADGMFRWAACQLDSLQLCLDRGAVRATLRGLPPDLNTTYARIIENIPQQSKKKAIRLLQFLAYSERSLTLPEAVDLMAVSLESNNRYFDLEDRLPRPADITRFCPGLVSLSRVPSGDDEIREEVQLAHFSVKEYLLHYDVEGFQGIEPSVNITLICLSYLSSFEESHVDEITTAYPLAEYAANTWMDHARRAETSRPVFTEAIGFLQNETKFTLWVNLLKTERECKSRKPLYHACRNGLLATAQHLLSNNADINALGGHYGNPLEAASFGGYIDIVKMLLDGGADVNAKGGAFGNALQTASFNGYKDIVQILLDRGADIDAEGGKFRSSLMAASFKGHIDIVQMLLGKGANVNPRRLASPNALWFAIKRGHTEIIRMLLDKGADTSMPGPDGHIPVWTAAYKGSKDIVWMLLNKGEDTNMQGPDSHAALWVATYRGHKDVVQMLLDKGVEPNVHSEDMLAALRIAVDAGYKDILQMFLDKRVDLDSILQSV